MELISIQCVLFSFPSVLSVANLWERDKYRNQINCKEIEMKKNIYIYTFEYTLHFWRIFLYSRPRNITRLHSVNVNKERSKRSSGINKHLKNISRNWSSTCLNMKWATCLLCVFPLNKKKRWPHARALTRLSMHETEITNKWAFNFPKLYVYWTELP